MEPEQDAGGGPQGPPERDTQVFNALSSASRTDILRALAGRPKTVQDLTRELRVPRMTLRYHLTVLLGQGLVEEVRAAGLRRVGRPAKQYRAARRAAVPGYPKRRYDLLGEIALDALIQGVGDAKAAAILRGQGRRIGEAMIRGLADRNGVDRWTPEAFERVVLRGYYETEGARTEIVSQSTGGLTYRSFHCPFLELAEKRAALVCDALDIGFHRGVDRALGGVRSERKTCMAHGAPFCEYRMRWPDASPRMKAKRHGLG